MEKKLTINTNYKTAINWCHNSYVLCNNLPDIDQSIWCNMRWDYYCEELDEYHEIFQWFVSDCSLDEVEFLEKHFSSIYFTYSDLLDCFVLCVTHYGTSWEGIHCYTDIETAERK